MLSSKVCVAQCCFVKRNPINVMQMAHGKRVGLSDSVQDVEHSA